MEKNDFVKISKKNYKPKLGDVKVFGGRPGHTAGHIEAFDSEGSHNKNKNTNDDGSGRWYSDYSQNNEPPPSYVGAPYEIYRLAPSDTPPSNEIAQPQSREGCGCAASDSPPGGIPPLWFPTTPLGTTWM